MLGVGADGTRWTVCSDPAPGQDRLQVNADLADEDLLLPGDNTVTATRTTCAGSFLGPSTPDIMSLSVLARNSEVTWLPAQWINCSTSAAFPVSQPADTGRKLIPMAHLPDGHSRRWDGWTSRDCRRFR